MGQVLKNKIISQDRSVIDGLGKSRIMSFFVIPAKAGIQYFQSAATTLDSGCNLSSRKWGPE
jgi:hypothetical protein